MNKHELELHEFLVEMLFVSIVADDHEDAMNDVLACITTEEDVDMDDLILASMFAGAYHTPTSMEQDALNDIRRMVAWRYLNG